MRSTALKSTVLLLVASTPFAQPRGESVDAILNQARKAMHRSAWAALDVGVELRGEGRVFGVDSGFLLFLGKEGQYRFATDGPLARTAAWDGATAWVSERGGPTEAVKQATRDEQRMPQWVHSSFWLAESAPLKISLVSEDAAGDELALDLASTESTVAMRLFLNETTWLPERLEFETEAGASELLFSDYRPVAGVLLAHRVVMRQAGLEGFIAAESAGIAGAGGVASCRYEERGATDATFDASVAPEVEVRRVRSGHLLVHPTVEGEDLGWFILDSGAGQSCIDPAVADKLGLPEFGAVPAVGIGGTITTSFRQGKHFELGPLSIDDTVYVELELGFLEPVFGVPVAGICGYDLFARSVVELDLEGPTLALHDPSDYQLARGEWAELTLDDRLPSIRCSFEGERSGLFKIDTGDAGTVSFYTPAVERLGLLEGRDVRDTQIGGVGGMQTAKRGELEWIEVGGHRHESVDTTFVTVAEGAFTDASVLGSLGSRLLAPFTIVFDYPSARIALVARGGSDPSR